MELFFAVHRWLGTGEEVLLPPLGLLLHEGDIIQLSEWGGGRGTLCRWCVYGTSPPPVGGFNMFICHAVLDSRWVPSGCHVTVM